MKKVISNSAKVIRTTSTKIESKKIDLLKLATKETKQAKKKESASFKNVVLNTNNILKQECFKLGYSIKVLLLNEETIFNGQKLNSEFTEFDFLRLQGIFKILQATKDSSNGIYKELETLKGIKTKSGKFSPFFTLRTINTNYAKLNALLK